MGSGCFVLVCAHLNLFSPGLDYPSLKGKHDLEDAKVWGEGWRWSADFNLLRVSQTLSLLVMERKTLS
jgi:hypothetical protein